MRPTADLPRAEIVAAYEGGASIYALAQRYGVSDGTLRARLVGWGVEIRPRAAAHHAQRQAPPDRPEQPRIDVAALRVAYVAGTSIESLAATQGVDPKTIRRHLVGAGVEIRNADQGGYRAPLLPADEISAAYQGGVGLKALAATYGVSAGTIRRALVGAGIEIRAQGDRTTVLPDAAIAAEYQSGRTLEAIGRRYNVSATTIANHLRPMGIAIRPAGTPFDDADVDYAAAAVHYHSGAPLDVVADAVGVGATTLRRRFAAMGIPIRPPGTKPNGVARRVILPIDDLVRLYGEGVGLDELARRFNCSHPTIRARLVDAWRRDPTARQAPPVASSRSTRASRSRVVPRPGSANPERGVTLADLGGPMRRRRWIIALAVVPALAVVHAVQPDAAAERTETRPDRPTAVSGVVAPGVELAQLEHDVADVGAYLQVLAIDEVGRYLADLAAADEAARLRAQSANRIPDSGFRNSSGDCSAFPLPAEIIERESGGDPNAVNSESGTFGCAQLQPSHFADGGACAGYSTDQDGQVACTIELQRRAGMSPWQ